MLFRLFVVVIAFISCESVPNGIGLSSYAPVLSGGLSSLSNNFKTPIGASYAAADLGYGLGWGNGLGAASYAMPVAAAPIAPIGPVTPLLTGPQVLDVAGMDEPVQVVFRSLGARVHVQQLHTPSGPPQVEQHRTEEEPHRVLHEILRPVIQEVHEVIQPYRRVTQEVRPVLEEVHTVVAKSDHGAGAGAGAAVGGPGLGLSGHGVYSSSKRA